MDEKALEAAKSREEEEGVEKSSATTEASANANASVSKVQDSQQRVRGPGILGGKARYQARKLIEKKSLSSTGGVDPKKVYRDPASPGSD
mmetsp:Transcript_26262/g.62450  ORF Transcript_26262/g.62450 Transcript_26262/m.62450 type:complete len:90 (+) Transcript_26262:1-270(+)